jgi:hypothetical protein
MARNKAESENIPEGEREGEGGEVGAEGCPVVGVGGAVDEAVGDAVRSVWTVVAVW